VNYKERLPGRRLALQTVGLALWFLVCLVVSIAAVDEWLADNVFSWMPDSLLQFAVVEEDDGELAGGELVAFVLVALAFNGIAGPVVEELYFRGHLPLLLALAVSGDHHRLPSDYLDGLAPAQRFRIHGCPHGDQYGDRAATRRCRAWAPVARRRPEISIPVPP
jgi:hypothetical protein